MANFCTFIGRLGADPEQKHIEGKGGSTPLVEFTIASDRYPAKDPLWIKVSVWDERLQIFALDYLKKGSSVAITGKLDARPYVPKNGGDPNPGLTLKADRIEFVGGKKKEDSGNDGYTEYDDF